MPAPRKDTELLIVVSKPSVVMRGSAFLAILYLFNTQEIEMSFRLEFKSIVKVYIILEY